MARHRLAHFADFPMPALRHDAYYGAFMAAARLELESNRYAFCDVTGREFEAGKEVSRYSNPADYEPARFVTRRAIFEDVFSRAIKSRAARLHNRAAA